MAGIATNRIKRELQEIIKSDEDVKQLINVEPINDNLQKLKGFITGPPGTAYDSGRFYLDIEIPETYPFYPPKIKFINRVWHPNVSSVTGVICLDILKDQWAAAMSLRTVLLSIQALLASPEPDDPQDAVVSNQFKTNYDMFLKTAKFWTSKYANGNFVDSECDLKLGQLKEMGVNEEQAINLLSMCNWDMEETVNKCFS